MRRHAASALFVFALVCFATPWFGLAIAGRDLVTFSGMEVAFGTRFSNSSPAAFLGDRQPQFSALFAAVCGAIGLLTNIFRRNPRVAPASAAAGAVAGLVVARVLFPHILMLRAASAVEVSARTGYYLAVILFLAAAALSAPPNLMGRSDN